MLKNSQFKLLIISILALALSGFLFWQGLQLDLKKKLVSKPSPPSKATVLGQNSNNSSSNQFSEQAKVTRVIDGDTIEVEIGGEQKKVRLIGIDTPETVDPRRAVGCFGKEASDETKRVLESKQVSLEKDVSETDKFGRSLRYVYLKLDDETILFVNDYLVRQGFAHALTFPPDIKYSQRFVEAQKEARESLRGLWARCK